MTTTAVGLIGCGFFARNHLHAWRDLAAQGAALAAVCDIDPARAKAGRDAETSGADNLKTFALVEAAYEAAATGGAAAASGMIGTARRMRPR